MPVQVNERTSSALGVRYISSNKKFITETGVVFTHDEVRGKSVEEIKALYEERLTGVLYDYAYTKSTGFFRKHKNMAEVRAHAQEMLHENNVTIEEPQRQKEILSGSQSLPVTILRVVMGLVGMAAILLSANYTTEFLRKSNTSFISYVLSWSMIVFSVAAFDIIVYFWMQPNKKHRLLSGVFAVLWIVVVCFSMFSTMEVNFSRYKALEVASVQDYAQVNTARLSADILMRQIEALERSVKEKTDAATAYANREVVSAWYLQQFQDDVTATTAKLETAYTELKDVYSQSSEALVTTETRAVTFYDSIEAMFGIQASKVHFIVHILPAVFIDIIAPFSIATALFLGGSVEISRQGRKKEGEDHEEERQEDGGSVL